MLSSGITTIVDDAIGKIEHSPASESELKMAEALRTYRLTLDHPMRRLCDRLISELPDDIRETNSSW